MKIRVLFFGVLKDMVGRPSDSLDLPEGARVSDVLAHYAGEVPRLEGMLGALALSVNQEYSGAERIDGGTLVSIQHLLYELRSGHVV